MIQTVPQLIDDYLRTAMEVTSRMSAGHGVDNPWLAYLKGELPQRGPLSPREGGTYRFHGVGCHFRTDDIDIEIDFGPGGMVGGFDAYRLVYFARHTLGAEEFDVPQVRQELERMHEKGELIKHPQWSDSLYFPAKQTAAT
jgi:hypothetical protein